MIWVLFLLDLSSAEVLCEAYTCELASFYIEENTCVYYKSDLAIPTYYASPCYDLNQNFCPPSFQLNSTCTVPPKVVNLKYPGEKCRNNDECGPFTTGCKNQICQGLVEGQKCLSHEFCNPGLRCNLTCVPQITVGQTGCKSDYDCENRAGCDFSGTGTGTCVLYWSLSIYASIQSCVNNSNWLCASSTCSGKQCVGAVKSGVVPKNCRNNSDCISSDSTVQGSCECGKNKNANAYCKLFYGDSFYLQYFGIAGEWISSGFSGKCNTFRRFSYVCAGDWWDRKSAYLMNYYYYYSQMYPYVVEYDQCIGKVYLTDFLAVKSLLGNILTVESAGFILDILLVIYICQI